MAPILNHASSTLHVIRNAQQSASSNKSQSQGILDPGVIAGITIGVLGALVIAFFIVGTFINYFYVRRRAKRNARIEAEHQRWASAEIGYPTDHARHNYYQPNPFKHITPHRRTPQSGSVDRLIPNGVGIAVSPEVARSESPESCLSQSSVTAAGSSKALPALPAYSPAAAGSSVAVFGATHNPQVAGGGQNQGAATNSSSLRPRQPPPARLHIPIKPSSPPPIKIFPPPENDTSRGTGNQTNGNISHAGSSRSNSSSPPNYTAFPAPPAPIAPRPNSNRLPPPPPLPNQQITHRKETPSYLPAYYTTPTPAAPVQPIGAQQNNAAAETVNSATPITSAISAGLELDPSSASSIGSDTTFESTDSPSGTPPENQSPHTRPLVTNPESPLKDFRYPRIPRPSNQSVPRSSPSKLNSTFQNGTISRRDFATSSEGQQVVGSLGNPEQACTIGQDSSAVLSSSSSAYRGQTRGDQWPQRESSKKGPGGKRPIPEMIRIPSRPQQTVPRVANDGVFIHIDSH